MPQVRSTDQTGAIGVTLVQLAVEQKLGWIFRRIDHRDTGIDAQVEVVLAGKATGLLLSLQIKTGPSYFKEVTANGWRFRGERDHLVYWKEHSLAVVVVLVDPATGSAYWAPVGADAQPTGKGFSLVVERSRVVEGGCAQAWMDLAFARDPADAMWRYLRLHQRYLDILAADGRLVLKIDEWVNKSIGRMDTTLMAYDSSGNEVFTEAWVTIGSRDVEDLLRRLFPWADASDAEDVERDDDILHPSEVDPDTGRPWREDDRTFRPYTQTAGEVDSYRVDLALNTTGEAYLALLHAANALPRYPPYHLLRE